MNAQATNRERNATDRENAIGALLSDLIDYAGLFPPASLSMGQSVANYDDYMQSEWNWILGRYVVPISRLDELAASLLELPAETVAAGSSPWRLSVLAGSDISSEVQRISEFNRAVNSKVGRKVIIESIEAKVSSAAEVERLAKEIPDQFEAYFEFPLADSADCLAAIAACSRRAKIRTGGETSDKFPPAENVIEFIRRCAASGIPFKATAGLHHPLRSVHRFNYQPESPSGVMHGFMNLFLAAAFLQSGLSPTLATQLLLEQSVDAFTFETDAIEWREHRLSREEIAMGRRCFAVSFGSCSFQEPIDDLRSLHWL